jgi:hypothetical protein
MSIIYFARNPASFVLYSGPVQDYIDRVIAADVAAGNNLGLETAVRDAYSNFITNRINDGVFGTNGGVLSQANSIIKGAFIMGGAQTISGALVPLIGSAPTRSGTESGWNYNRKTGLRGNGTNNDISSNRAANLNPQNNAHIAIYTTVDGQGCATGTTTGAETQLLYSGTSRFFRVNVGANDAAAIGSPSATGYWGASRPSATSILGRHNGINYTFSNNTSAAPGSAAIRIFSRGANFYTGRILFWSTGENIDHTLSDTRLTALANAISAAIP